ncbi:aminotransferase class I/II-fold pyridoxal phosphate-dependent enzyme [Streptomyces sp. Ru73]|uniref:aminotransferase class I/II-fold pyridoxal phosphate-dependent enzyme n=1 Tax=Streptomyces sp. Ru73 TaxID=2080748 RepID=UPI0015E3916D|nr:aminotransferase class I/II-fold pyridoxal phosphate-dependent enzyme [Streptomyces sp. Ru73]
MRHINSRSCDGTSDRNAHAPLPSAVRAAQEALGWADPSLGPLCVELVAEVAQRIGVAEESVVLGTGGPSLAFALLRSVACGAPGTALELIVPHGGYDLYADLARRLPAAVCTRVPATADGRQDLPALAARATGRNSVILLGNPQDPTGTVIRGAELCRFLDAVPPEAMVVLDETHWEFVRDPGFTPAAGLINRYPRLVVVRNLSVVHGLGGLRLAYAAGAPDLIEVMQRQILPHDVSMLAQLVALASLRTPAEVRSRTDAIVRERERLREELRLLGFQVPPSETNQLWLPLGRESMRFALAGRAQGADIALRPGEGVRITAGPPEHGDRVLRAAAAFACASATPRCDSEVIDRL